MSCNNVELTVLNGFSNTETLVAGEKVAGDVSPMDFTTTTRMVLELYDADDVLIDTVDSAISPTAIVWTANPTEGEIVLDLGGESLAAGNYNARLIQYSPTKVSGEIIDRGDLYTFDVEVKDV